MDFEEVVSHALSCLWCKHSYQLWFKVLGFGLLFRSFRQDVFHYYFHEITHSKRPQLVFLFTKQLNTSIRMIPIVP